MSTQASNTTANYGLSQWAESDRILMTDFNADNAAIDAALKANADSITEAAAGAFTLESGSYTGTGTYGSANPTTITTEKTPVVVWIRLVSPGSSYQQHFTSATALLLRGATLYSTDCIQLTPSTNVVTKKTCYGICGWDDKTLTLYCASDMQADTQMNASGSSYQWMALCR